MVSHLTNSALGNSVVDGWCHGGTDAFKEKVEGGAKQALHVGGCGDSALHRRIEKCSFRKNGSLRNATI